MKLPTRQETLNQKDFFIYAAADSVYFDIHARPLINSVLRNMPELGIHIHIYDPTPEQITFCQRPGVSCTYEHLNPVDFNKITDRWIRRTDFDNDRQRQMFKKGQTLGAQE